MVTFDSCYFCKLFRKYEKINPPHAEDLFYRTDNTYTKKVSQPKNGPSLLGVGENVFLVGVLKMFTENVKGLNSIFRVATYWFKRRVGRLSSFVF